MEKKNNIFKYFLILVIGAGIMYGVIYFFPQSFSEVITRTEKDVTVTDNGIADAVDKVYDAVVIVSTYKDGNLISSGTGFIYEVDGDDAYILTNDHVISGGNKIQVTLTDGKVIEVDLIGSNEYEDVAVLKMDAEDVTGVVELGSSEDLRVGDTLFAVGAPLDSAFSWTVTRGILSGKDRLVDVPASNAEDPAYIMNVLQTDTAINNGNSGGPLCNSNGEVIGMNTLKLKEEGVEGMGFAIPIETVLEVVEEIENEEYGSQPFIGITMLDYISVFSYADNEEFAKYFTDNDLTKGILIVEVSEDSPADDANLKANDVITKLGDETINGVDDFKYELYQYSVGDTAIFTVIRDGKELEIEVEIKEK